MCQELDICLYKKQKRKRKHHEHAYIVSTLLNPTFI